MTTPAAKGDDAVPQGVGKWETPEGLKKVADFVRGRNGMPTRPAVLQKPEKRVEYFKGDKLLRFLVENTHKKRPDIKTEEEAIRICTGLLRHGYFHGSDKVSRGVVVLKDAKDYSKTGYYTWMYEGRQAFSNLLTTLIIVGFLLITCFPIWPMFLKVWMWYLSVTLLVFMLGFLLIRFLVFFGLWIGGKEFWILPRLFDETLGFTESFTPLYSFEPGPKGQGYWRLAALGGVAAFFYWAYTQPTEFDSFIAAQREFLDDLYEGNLLSDVSQESRENIDKPRTKSLEEILRELDEEPDEAEDLIDRLMEEMDFNDDDGAAEEGGDGDAGERDGEGEGAEREGEGAGDDAGADAAAPDGED
ncbi:unnamed protein product [Phaeothamnion confervicola]